MGKGRRQIFRRLQGDDVPCFYARAQRPIFRWLQGDDVPCFVAKARRPIFRRLQGDDVPCFYARARRPIFRWLQGDDVPCFVAKARRPIFRRLQGDDVPFSPVARGRRPMFGSNTGLHFVTPCSSSRRTSRSTTGRSTSRNSTGSRPRTRPGRGTALSHGAEESEWEGETGYVRCALPASLRAGDGGVTARRRPRAAASLAQQARAPLPQARRGRHSGRRYRRVLVRTRRPLPMLGSLEAPKRLLTSWPPASRPRTSSSPSRRVVWKVGGT